MKESDEQWERWMKELEEEEPKEWEANPIAGGFGNMFGSFSLKKKE